MKKPFAAAIVLLLSLALSACTPDNSVEKPTETPTATETPAPTENPTATATPAPTGTPTPTLSPTPTLTPTPIGTPTPTPFTEPPITEGSLKNTGCHPITLSGNRDDHVITDRYCFIEGEKFFLLLDKDVDLPGDFADNIALIMDTLESLTGLRFDASRELESSNLDQFAGEDPWDALQYGTKVPIYILIDRNDEHFGTGANAGRATIYDFRLFSDAVWNSVPSYRDNPERRNDFVEYLDIAHELTHVLTLRSTQMTDIMTEGSAEYYSEKALRALSDKVEEFRTVLAAPHIVGSVEKKITADTAEDIFLTDYTDLSFAERGEQYVVGHLLCRFLNDTYGPSFLSDYIKVLRAAGYRVDAYILPMSEKDYRRKTDAMKEVFGDDVFVRFGKWYSEGAH